MELLTVYGLKSKDDQGFRITKIFKNKNLKELLVVLPNYSRQPRKNQKILLNGWNYCLKLMN